MRKLFWILGLIIFPAMLKYIFCRYPNKPRGPIAYEEENVPRKFFMAHPGASVSSDWLRQTPFSPPPLVADMHPKVQPPHFSSFQEEEADLTLYSLLARSVPLTWQHLPEFCHIWLFIKSALLCSRRQAGAAVSPGLRPENMDWTEGSRIRLWCILALLCSAGFPQKVRQMNIIA